MKRVKRWISSIILVITILIGFSACTTQTCVKSHDTYGVMYYQTYCIAYGYEMVGHVEEYECLVYGSRPVYGNIQVCDQWVTKDN